jgi:hypothetical protein
MTNYNEKLDELLTELRSGTINFDDKAKQAITSLIKELVVEAKPKKRNTDVGDAYQRTFCGEYNKGIEQFEQNLLKALEQL